METIINIYTKTSSLISEPFKILLPLGLIIIFAKILSIFCKKVGIPQVIGFLLSGIILGVITLIPGQPIFTDETGAGIDFIAKIGVILIMFSAGMETDLKKIKETGASAMVVTILGVLVPLAMGAGLAFIFFKADNTTAIWSNIFYGIILTATSISITVSVLKELGKLDTKVGAIIESAAILDDIIGIILLSIVLSLGTSNNPNSVPFIGSTGNANLDIVLIVAFMLGFFVLCGLLWWPINKLFAWLNNKWPKHRRIPIFGFGLAFILAYVAEAVFGVADITGAFMAGLMLSKTASKEYIDHKADNETGLIFSPVFFASIGLMLWDLEGISTNMILFGVLYIIIGLLSKIIGAGVGGLITKNSFKDSLTIGVGMMVRAEVIIVCATKGIESGLVSEEIMPFVILIILSSSLIAPILLKLLCKDKLKKDNQLSRSENITKKEEEK